MTGTDSGPGTPWTKAPIVALDLEGSGAQDKHDEAILEIAIVPLAAGRPSFDDAYTTLVNPGRPIPRRPWISPGLTNETLADAPTLDHIEPELATRLNGRIIVGHNVGVDWRLLHRSCPTIQPAGLIDTLRLARHLHPGQQRIGLTTLLDRYHLTEAVTRSAPSSQPHRALYDTVGAALLLAALIEQLPHNQPELPLAELWNLAHLPFSDSDNGACTQHEQLPLL